MFNKKLWYDCTILDTKGGPVFAKLVLVFTIMVAGKIYPIVLVQLFVHKTAKGALGQKDKDLEFLRLRQLKDKKTEFVFVRSIVCGAVVEFHCV